MLGAAFGMAFIIGPPLGGLAADYDPSFPFLLSIVESLLLLGAVRYLLPEPATKMASDAGKKTGEESCESWRRPSRIMTH